MTVRAEYMGSKFSVSVTPDDSDSTVILAIDQFPARFTTLLTLHDAKKLANELLGAILDLTDSDEYRHKLNERNAA